MLRDSQRVTLDDVLAGGSSGGRIFESLNAMLADPKNHNRHVPWADWQKRDTDNVTAARQEYLRSWALCYLLLHNPNYGPRFKLLGRKYVSNHDCEFASVFASVRNEIAFEYSFFLKNICAGYRVDLCSWDWANRSQPVMLGSGSAVGVDAAKGYQAAGLALIQGKRYQYTADGTWSTSAGAETTSATGGADDVGRLCGVVMTDYKLSQPFPLGVAGVFEAPASGQLYLRCQDGWNGLHDNTGQITVCIQPAE
jgi:hypothetical protein